MKEQLRGKNDSVVENTLLVLELFLKNKGRTKLYFPLTLYFS